MTQAVIACDVLFTPEENIWDDSWPSRIGMQATRRWAGDAVNFWIADNVGVATNGRRRWTLRVGGRVFHVRPIPE
jgi:hypothetical protein